MPEATALSAFFNAALNQALADILTLYPLLDLIEFDIFSLSSELYADPLSFGFTNATDACYSKFVDTGGTICANPDAYISWDGFHQTTLAHAEIAARMTRAVPEPVALVLLSLGLAGLGCARRRISR